MQAAIIIRDNALREINTGTLVKHVPTVEELYYQTKKLFNISIKTWKRHETTYKNSIKKYENREITSIKPIDVQESINESINNYSLEATQRVLSLWRQIYKAAAMNDILVADKTVAVTIPKSKAPAKQQKKVLISDEDFKQFIEYLEETSKYVRDSIGRFRRIRIIYMLKIMFFTGIRPSECFALTKSDINLITNSITINKAIGSTSVKTRQVISTKTTQSIRTVPISKDLKPIIMRMIDEIKEEHLFYDHDGLPFETSFLSQFISRISNRIGIKFNMYMLRHRMATDLIQSNTSARTVQDILGHATYKQSVGYARSSDEDRKTAIDNRKLS
jgi:integrase